MLLSFSATTHASILNSGFESGSFQDWKLNIPRGTSTFAPNSRLAGTAQVTSAWSTQAGASQLRSAVEGNYFAVLGSLADGSFMGNRAYNITLTRSIHLLAGETLEGSSFFYNGDFQAQDSAWVKILDEDGCPIAQPWFQISGNSHTSTANSTPYQTASLWTPWSWQAPVEGDYALSLGVTTGGDNNMPSYGFFDDIVVCASKGIAPVPEPSSLTLVVIGAAGLAALRRKNKQS